MPNITEFDAGNLALHPSETGVESFAAAGRRAGAFYNQAAEAKARLGSEIGRDVATVGDTAVAYMDHQQINAGADHGATLFANLTDSWNKTSATADVHDPSVAKKWREEQLEPALEQFSQGFTTQKSQDWANRFVNTQREHFFAKTEADMSSMASAAVHESVTNAVTKYSNTAVTDPSSVDTSIALFRQNLDDVIAANPNIKGPDAARVRLEVADKGVRQIVQAGAMGAVMNARDPEAAATAFAKKYPDYVSGAEELQLARAAKIQAKQNTLLTTQLQNEQKRAAEINMNSALNDSWTKNVTIQPDGTFHIDPQFVKDVNEITKTGAPNAWRVKEEMGKFIESQQKAPKGGVSDPAVVADLNNRMLLGDNPTTQMDLIRNHTQLSNADFDFYDKMIKLRDEQPIKDPVFKSAIQAAKDSFTYSSQNTSDDPLGSRAFAAFQQNFLAEYQKEARTSTLKPNALNMRDPTSLISQSIAQARGSLQDAMRTPAASKVFAPPPDWFSNGKGEFADPAGNVYDKDGKPTGRKINASTLSTQWPIIPTSQ